MLIESSAQVTISHTNIYNNEADFVSVISEPNPPTPPGGARSACCVCSSSCGVDGWLCSKAHPSRVRDRRRLRNLLLPIEGIKPKSRWTRCALALERGLVGVHGEEEAHVPLPLTCSRCRRLGTAHTVAALTVAALTMVTVDPSLTTAAAKSWPSADRYRNASTPHTPHQNRLQRACQSRNRVVLPSLSASMGRHAKSACPSTRPSARFQFPAAPCSRWAPSTSPTRSARSPRMG